MYVTCNWKSPLFFTPVAFVPLWFFLISHLPPPPNSNCGFASFLSFLKYFLYYILDFCTLSFCFAHYNCYLNYSKTIFLWVLLLARQLIYRLGVEFMSILYPLKFASYLSELFGTNYSVKIHSRIYIYITKIYQIVTCKNV